MSSREIAPYRNPLDVLWRGVPTPYKADVRVAQMCISVECNDPALLGCISRRSASSVAQGKSKFLWRIVRDDEAPGEIEPAISLKNGPVTFAAMSAALTVGVDSDRKELLAFVGGSVDTKGFNETVFPMFEKMTLDAVATQADAETSRAAPAFANQHEDA